MTESSHIIIGGGIIGLSVGWQLARSGARVEIYESSSAIRSGAGWNAAGMLAPSAEAGYEEEALFNLCKESLSLYDNFLFELSQDVRHAEVPKLDRCGSMLVALTSDDVQVLHRQYEFRKSIGETDMELLRAAEAREREPLLSPKVKQALYLPNDAQINNRKLLEALHEAFINCGGVLHEHQNVDVIKDNFITAKSITLSAGALISKISDIDSLGIRPVKGQVVTLKTDPSVKLQHLIRSPRVYLAQKDDDRLLIGASVEEKGTDKRITAGPVMELLHYAWEAVPLVYELEITELQSGFRPATRDHCPVIGAAGHDNIFYAAGHYRNGILLAPITAYALRDEILLGKKRNELSMFSPQRFMKNTIHEVV
jgi:glycine oxidase